MKYLFFVENAKIKYVIRYAKSYSMIINADYINFSICIIL